MPSLLNKAFLDHLRTLFNSVKKHIIELNLFPIIPPSQDIKILCRHRRLTRIYLTLLFISFLILAVYTLIAREIKTVTLKSPFILAYSQYSQLFNQYPQTFQCSCSNISVKYSQFINIEPKYHSMCSSDFFSSDRYNTIWNLNEEDSLDGGGILSNDFRSYIRSHMKIVEKMCSISKNITKSSLSLWLQKDFITERVISPIELNIRIQGLIEEFNRTTANELLLLFELLQVTNSANQLATVTSSNWQFIDKPRYNIYLMDQYDPETYLNHLQALALPKRYYDDDDETDCSCGLQSNCSRFSTSPYGGSNQWMQRTLRTFLIGCTPLDAMFQSDFSCFYNRTCLYTLQSSIYFMKSFPVKVLISSSLLSSSNRTIKTILSRMFVEEWLGNTSSYDRYYNQCAPQLCQYSYLLGFDVIYFISKTLAITGGLTKVLRFTVSFIALIVIKLITRKRKSQITANSNIVVTDLDNVTRNTLLNVQQTPIEVNVNPIEEQIESSNNRKDRIIVICLGVLIIVAIIATSIISIVRRNTEYISTTTSLTTLLTTIKITEPTTISSESCYMTLIYQNETYSIGHGAKSYIFQDFNQDSFLDLAVTNYDNHTFSILFGNGDGTFQTQQVYSTGDNSYPWDIASADFNNDTFLDIAITLSTKRSIAIFFGTASNGSFGNASITLTHCNINAKLLQIDAHDLNDDGLTDLLVTCTATLSADSDLYAMLNLGNGYDYRHKFIWDRGEWHIDSFVIGDFSNDGREIDISFYGHESKVYTVETINPNGDYQHARIFSLNKIHGKPQSIIRGRFNDDEVDDIALIAPESDTLHVLLNRGFLNFLQQIYHIDNSPRSIVRINFNNDSIDDLAILGCNQTVNIYLGTESGIFDQPKISFQISQNHTSQCFQTLKAADLNQDGKDDLTFIDPNTQSIRVLLSANCNEHF